MKRVLGVAMLAVAVLFAAGAVADEVKGEAKTEKTEMKAEKKPVTIKGEIVDTGCYISHGAMGEKHKDCATKCIAGGMPMGLLSGKTLYLLTMNHDNPDAYNKCKDLASQTVEITGLVAERNGVKAIDVTDVKAPAAAASAK